MDTQIKVSVHICVDRPLILSQSSSGRRCNKWIPYMEIEYLLELACNWDYHANLAQSQYDHLCFIGKLTSYKSYYLSKEIGIYLIHILRYQYFWKYLICFFPVLVCNFLFLAQHLKNYVQKWISLAFCTQKNPLIHCSMLVDALPTYKWDQSSWCFGLGSRMFLNTWYLNKYGRILGVFQAFFVSLWVVVDRIVIK